jgi:hypothetical protein
MKKSSKIPKIRNPFVQHLIGKKQGAHGKTKKSIRRAEKIALNKKDWPSQVAA